MKKRWALQMMDDTHTADKIMDGLRRAEIVINELPSAEPTLYGYKIEHLAFIARVMKRENVPPEKVIEILTDVGRVATIILAEQERIIKQEVETWI